MVRIFFVLLIFLNTTSFAGIRDTTVIKISDKNPNYVDKIDSALKISGSNSLKLIFYGTFRLSKELQTYRDNTVFSFGKGTKLIFTTSETSGIIIRHNKCSVIGALIEGNGISSKNFYAGFGILLSGVKKCAIKNNNFTNISGVNILIMPNSSNVGCSNNQIANNRIINPVMDLGLDGDESGILLGYAGYGYKHQNNIISNNFIDGNSKLKIGIGIISHGDNNIIKGNLIENCRHYGILAYESKDVDSSLVRTNISYNIIRNIGESGNKLTMKGMGIYLMKAIRSTVSNNKVYNTLINSDRSETLGAGAISISISPETQVINNIVDGSHMYGITTDYSFNSVFTGNIIRNTKKSGMYFLNISNVIVERNKFENIGAVVLKGYFENTSLRYIKDQMRTDKYLNRSTGSDFKIINNIFYTDKEILFFTGTEGVEKNGYLGNRIEKNLVSNNKILRSRKSLSELFAFRIVGEKKNIIKNNKIM